MRAIVCHKLGAPSELSYEQMADPKAAPGQVVVDINAAYSSFTDLLQVQGLYQMRAALPFIVGSEFSGVIREVGDDIDHYKIGDRVMGVQLTGAYAERCAIAAGSVFPAPRTLSDEQIACVMSAGTTAHYALTRRACLRNGETLLVTGASGAVGLCAVQLGKALKARVVAVCSSDEKLELAREYGADVLINHTQQDLKTCLREVSGGKGVDVALELVGGPLFEPIARNIAPYGRLLVAGFASGTIPKFAVNLALLKEFSLIGVNIGHYAAHNIKGQSELVEEVIDLCLLGELRPHIEAELPLAEAPKVLELYRKRSLKGKVILRP